MRRIHQSRCIHDRCHHVLLEKWKFSKFLTMLEVTGTWVFGRFHIYGFRYVRLRNYRGYRDSVSLRRSRLRDSENMQIFEQKVAIFQGKAF